MTTDGTIKIIDNNKWPRESGWYNTDIGNELQAMFWCAKCVHWCDPINSQDCQRYCPEHIKPTA